MNPGLCLKQRFCTILLALAAFAAVPAFGAPWAPFGPDGGDARRLEPDPKDHTHLYLGAANGWIFESHDAGASWVRLAQIGKRDDLVLDSILVDPRQPRHIVVGAWVLDHPDGGLFVSDDGGKTWINQAQMRGQSVRALALSTSNPDVMVAGSLQGVFRSGDGGKHWTQISPADSKEIHEIQSVAIDPEDPATVYAGTWHLPWKTTDGGENWHNIKQGIIDDSDVFSIIVDPKQPKIVYASACSGIYKSEDAGELFHKVQGIPSAARRTRVLLQDPQNLDRVFAGTTEGLFRTDDAGKNWARITGPEIVVNDVSIDLSDSKRVLIATNRGGVLASDDGGDSFHSSNQGFSARQITALKRDAKHPASLFVGVVNDKEWGGVFQSDDSGVNWVQRSDGLQGADVFSLGQAPDGTMLAGTAHGMFRLDREKSAWNRVEKPVDGLAPAVVQPAVLPVSTRPSAVVSRNEFARVGGGKTRAAGSGRKAAPTRRQGKAVPSQARSSKHGARAGNAARVVRSKSKPVARAAGKHSAAARPVQRAAVATPAPEKAPAQPQAAAAPPVQPFDGSVYGFTTTGKTLLASTSAGLLISKDDGESWALSGLRGSSDWRMIASARENVIAAGLHNAAFSPDAGATWSPVRLPDGITLISAIAVEPSGQVWLGCREGLYISPDAGNTWSHPKDLYANAVNSLYYDESANRMTVAAAGPRGVIYTVQLPQRSITYFESGWNIRFARPLDDHLIAATLFDGIIIQPRMISAPASGEARSSAEPVAAASKR